MQILFVVALASIVFLTEAVCAAEEISLLCQYERHRGDAAEPWKPLSKPEQKPLIVVRVENGRATAQINTYNDVCRSVGAANFLGTATKTEVEITCELKNEKYPGSFKFVVDRTSGRFNLHYEFMKRPMLDLAGTCVVDGKKF